MKRKVTRKYKSGGLMRSM